LDLLFVYLLGLIFLVTGACFATLAFLHSNEQVARKQSILVIVSGVLVTVLQPYFNIFEVSAGFLNIQASSLTLTNITGKFRNIKKVSLVYVSSCSNIGPMRDDSYWA
jgi:hypothetical protein